MAKRGPKKRSAAALFDSIRTNVENDAAGKTFSDAAVQTDQSEFESAAGANLSDAKLNKCLTLLAHANAKLDALGSSGSSRCQHECQAIGVQKIPMEPVKSLRELELLEENTKQKEFVASMMASIGQLHGRKRYTGKGGSVCLQIVDYFFDRQFLLQCSWTGTGRKHSEQEQVLRKIPFSKFESTIKLFHQTVLQSDPEYSFDECKAFLHRCLRNAKQRFEEIGGVRKPAARKRKLRDANEQEEEYEEEIVEDESGQSSLMYVEDIDQVGGSRGVWEIIDIKRCRERCHAVAGDA
ncbi:uncharacterized protein LOC134288392 [Aedes albopictus]|uniref:DUF4806 domain-containing protein n=1 Tax=Aedes albopictus TaxID=7160 RepID=A0ABM1Y5S7_AEDAL